MGTSAQTTGDPKTSNMQRPTSLTVTQAVSSSPPGAATNAEAKTPSPVKQPTQTTIIQIPPSPNQTKFSSTSPASMEAPTATTNTQQPASSVSFIEMASSFFRWGGKGGNSSATVTSQPEINVSKLELSPKSVTVDVEVSGTEQLVKSNKAVDKIAQAPVINVITNPNENIRISNTPNPSYIVSGPSGKQRTSRKTMRAPQPPILDTPKIESKISNQGPTQQTSPIDAADVQEKTEEKLLKLLSDFNSGKLKAFSEDSKQGGTNTMSKMEDIRDQQEALGKLHFELSGAGIGVVVDGRKQPAPLSKERLSVANDNMNRLMTDLEKLSLAIENLSPAISAHQYQSSCDTEKLP